MKKLVVLCAVTLIAVTLTGCSAKFTSTLELTAQKTTLEEASSIIGVTVPVPTYLPEGYEIQEVYVQDRAVRLLISDDGIEKKLVTHTDAAGARQRYEFQSKMEMSVRWYSEGEPPIKLPGKKVKINESRGFIVGNGGHNDLWWQWNPDPSQPGMFELALSANRGVSEDELVKVAQSVQPSIPGLSPGPDTFISTLRLSAQKTTLEEASSITGVTVPYPTYLPAGYKIQEVYIIEPSHVYIPARNAVASTTALLISDEKIEKYLASRTGSRGIYRRYEYLSKMQMVATWLSDGQIGGLKLPGEWVSIGETRGVIVEQESYNDLRWLWRPDPDEPGIFEMRLSASKNIPKQELVKIAESVRY